MGDLNSRRGRIAGMDTRGASTIIRAQVPMAEMLTYEQHLTSATGGRGAYRWSTRTTTRCRHTSRRRSSRRRRRRRPGTRSRRSRTDRAPAELVRCQRLLARRACGRRCAPSAANSRPHAQGAARRAACAGRTEQRRRKSSRRRRRSARGMRSRPSSRDDSGSTSRRRISAGRRDARRDASTRSARARRRERGRKSRRSPGTRHGPTSDDRTPAVPYTARPRQQRGRAERRPSLGRRSRLESRRRTEAWQNQAIAKSWRKLDDPMLRHPQCGGRPARRHVVGCGTRQADAHAPCGRDCGRTERVTSIETPIRACLHAAASSREHAALVAGATSEHPSEPAAEQDLRHDRGATGSDDRPEVRTATGRYPDALLDPNDPVHLPLTRRAAMLRAPARRRWVEPLWQDFRFSVRALVRSPRFVLVVLATLTLGIGANVAAFSLVDAVLLRPLPFGSRSDRVVTLHSVYEQQVRALGGVSYPDLLDLQSRLRSFEGVAGLIRVNFTLSTEREADRLVGCYVTPELFRLLDVAPVLGRHFTFEDAAPPGVETTVILTHGLWQSRFGGDASIVGRAVTINDRPHTVVGVMPPGFRFPDRAELYLPLRLDVRAGRRSARTFTAIGVLKPDVTVAAAQADVDRRLGQAGSGLPGYEPRIWHPGSILPRLAGAA